VKWNKIRETDIPPQTLFLSGCVKLGSCQKKSSSCPRGLSLQRRPPQRGPEGLGLLLRRRKAGQLHLLPGPGQLHRSSQSRRGTRLCGITSPWPKAGRRIPIWMLTSGSFKLRPATTVKRSSPGLMATPLTWRLTLKTTTRPSGMSCWRQRRRWRKPKWVEPDLMSNFFVAILESPPDIIFLRSWLKFHYFIGESLANFFPFRSTSFVKQTNEVKRNLFRLYSFVIQTNEVKRIKFRLTSFVRSFEI